MAALPTCRQGGCIYRGIKAIGRQLLNLTFQHLSKLQNTKKIFFACLPLVATASLRGQNPQPIKGEPAHHPKCITPEAIAQSKT